MIAIGERKALSEGGRCSLRVWYIVLRGKPLADQFVKRHPGKLELTGAWVFRTPLKKVR